MNVPSPTLAELLKPYRSAAIAAAVGVTPDTVRLWRSEKTMPAADKIAALAAFLRVDASVMVKAVAGRRVCGGCLHSVELHGEDGCVVRNSGTRIDPPSRCACHIRAEAL